MQDPIAALFRFELDEPALCRTVYRSIVALFEFVDARRAVGEVSAPLLFVVLTLLQQGPNMPRMA